MPHPLFIIFLTILIGGISPSGVIFSMLASGAMFLMWKLYEAEAIHREAGTPWYYRPTFWIVFPLAFVAMIAIVAAN